MRHRLSAATAAMIVSFGIAACGSARRGSATIRTDGGTAYFAQQPESPPNYIFPLVSSEYFSVANTADFQTLMYRPLYWYGDQDRPGVDYALSIGNRPVYSDGNRVVTVTLKPTRWSDGEPVSAPDVGFWIDLVKANRDDWASYVPGGFPDNIVSWRALSERRIELRLNAPYDPAWFTDNELSQITPLPLAWDRTSLRAVTHAHRRDSLTLPEMTAARARAVYRFLNAESRNVAGYAGNGSIWSVVDGPWKLASFSSSGEVTFTPNRSYEGPDRPRLARFVELPFASETSEFSVLEAGSARGGGTGSQISVGYVPDDDIPDAGAIRRQGYRLIDFYPFGFDYFEPNFNNPTVGVIFRQLYFRQAFQHLVNQPGWIHSYYQGLGVPTYSAVPAQPANPYADRLAAVNPYPFSVAAARRLLRDHGWHVIAGGLTSCVRPGAGAHSCGRGIAAGKGLAFTLMYPTGMSSTDGAMADLQAVARQVGIEITLKQVASSVIDADIAACTPRQAACRWQLGQYGSAWVFAPDHYPTGEEIFQTGALGNVNNFSDPAIDRLIEHSTTIGSAGARAALNAYANALRLELPDFWQPSPGTMITVQANLRGMVPNAYGFINPEEWYFER